MKQAKEKYEEYIQNEASSFQRNRNPKTRDENAHLKAGGFTTEEIFFIDQKQKVCVDCFLYLTQ